MNMNELVKQSLEAAAEIVGISFEQAIASPEAQEIAFKLSCAAMAQEAAK